MDVSQRRIDANRRNSKLSTGPKTAEGKQTSRANALIHGLCCSVVVAEDAALVMGRSRDYFDTLKPQNNFHCWIVTQVALLSIQIDRAARIARRVRDKIAIKAELCWDDQRRLDAELLGEQLGNRPAVVVETLRATPQGCEWLMARWAMLAAVADEKKEWTPALERLAFDLQATPADFREGRKPGASIDFHGRVLDDGKDLAAFARREIDALMARMDTVNAIDEANRALAVADLHDDTDAELKRVRKQEGTLHSRLHWFMRQLQQEAPPREVPRWLKGTWLGYEEDLKNREMEAAKLPEIPPVPEPPPEWEVAKSLARPLHAPFELEPDEVPPIGQSPDFPQILTNRREKKLRQAEARREVKRRKLEKLRA